MFLVASYFGILSGHCNSQSVYRFPGHSDYSLRFEPDNNGSDMPGASSLFARSSELAGSRQL